MNKNIPKISVIIASYNHENYIKDSILSILGQTFQDFEIVITDDGSTDSTVSIINGISDPRIKLFVFEKNQGACAAGNNCIKHSRAEYIALMNSDDIWEESKLEKQIKFMESNPFVGACFTKAQFINEKGTLLESYRNWNIFNQENRTRFEWLNFFFNQGNCLCHPSILIRKKVYEHIGFYEERYASLPDLDMWVRMCLFYDIKILDEKLVKFRIRDDEANESGDRPENHIRSRFELKQILNHYLKLENRNEFILVFPEFKDVKFDDFEIPYLLGSLGLKSDKKNLQLWGLETIYNFLGAGSESSGEQYKRLGRISDFRRITRLYDVFNLTLENENKNLVNQLNKLNNILNLMSSSWSWKITAPLRKMRGIIKN